MLGTGFIATRPLASTPRLPRPFRAAAVEGEYGWAAWSFSRQAKLNAWAWHGLAGDNINSWAVLGGAIYFRRENDTFVHVMEPDVFLAADEDNTDSASVEATTQWLDFGKPGRRKALTGLDFDGQHVQAVEVYVSAGGKRDGVLAERLQVADAQAGWTYSGELLPLSSDGTEFKLRFICDPNQEGQINKVTLYYEEVQT